MPKFIKLKRGNDWGTGYIAPASMENGSSDARRGLKFKNREEVLVKYPNGTKEVIAIVLKDFYVTVNDMGCTSNVHYKLPGFNISYHGIETWVPLDMVEIELP